VVRVGVVGKINFAFSRKAATENSPQFQLRDSRKKAIESRQGRPEFRQKFSAAPPGLEIILHPNPQLKLRAIFICASGAFYRHMIFH
jgi:hypothetical protein